MPLIETRDGIVLEIPEGMAPDSPEVREAVKTERAGRLQRRHASPEFQEKVKANEAEMRKELDPTAGMGAVEKIRANIGAGMASAGQGARQILSAAGLAKPVSDEEVEEKRRLDKQLAEKTDLGIGPEWAPSAGKALQIAGEIAPTLAIPAGPATGAAARVLPRALQWATRGPIRTGVTGGAAAGALAPTTSEESRALNTALGGAGGAVLPLAMRGYRAGREFFSPAARAASRLEQAVGADAPGVAQAVAQRGQERAGQAPAVRAIPESLAEASGHTGIARIESELGRAEATADEMAAFKRAQNAARYEAVQQATREAPQLAGRSAVREATTTPMREQALRTAGGDPFFHVPVVQEIQRMAARPSSVNPAVRRVMDEVMQHMDERAQTAITPERLYEIRKLLADKLGGPTQIGDELSNAVKGASRETRALINSIDEALDQASGGQFRPYLREFERGSRAVDESRAAQEVRDVFQREGTPELGGAPEVTQTRLGAAMRASEGGAGREFPLQLSPSARQQLTDVGQQINRSNEVQKARKLAGTAGGGSQTSTDIDRVLTQLAQRSNIPGLSRILTMAGQGLDDATKVELAHLVQNPNQAMAAIRDAQRAREPLTSAQALLLQAMSVGAGSSLPLALQAQSGAR